MRGVTIGIFLLCLSVFSGFMAGAVSPALGVGMSGGLQDSANQTSDDLSGDQDLSDRGGQGGLLGFAVYAMDVLSGFFAVYHSVESMFATFAGGRFMGLWQGIQMLVVVIGTLMIVWVARGLIGE